MKVPLQSSDKMIADGGLFLFASTLAQSYASAPMGAELEHRVHGSWRYTAFHMILGNTVMARRMWGNAQAVSLT